MKALPPFLIAVAAAAAAPAAAAPSAMPVTRAAVERRAAQMFTVADLDHDGVLTRAEFQSAIVAQAQRYDPRVPTEGKGMDKAMAQFDAIAAGQPGGRITRNAFISAATAKFDAADLNRDGTVTPEEARAAGGIRKPEGSEPAKAKRKRTR